MKNYARGTEQKAFSFIPFISEEKGREEGRERLPGGAWQDTCSDFQNTTGSFICLFWHRRVKVEAEASALTITQVCLILFHLHASKRKYLSKRGEILQTLKAAGGEAAGLYQTCPAPYYSLHRAVSLNKSCFQSWTAATCACERAHARA